MQDPGPVGTSVVGLCRVPRDGPAQQGALGKHVSVGHGCSEEGPGGSEIAV